MLEPRRRASRRWIATALTVVYVAAMAVAGPSMQRLGLIFAIAIALAIGARRGFRRRNSESRTSAVQWQAAWIAAIALLIACEAWQFADRSTTVTSLVVPLLAIPVVRAVALAVWVRLGWALLS